MADGVHAAADREVFPRRRLGAGIGRHRHVRFGGHHKADALLVQPPQRGAIQKALIKDHLVQPGIARPDSSALG